MKGRAVRKEELDVSTVEQMFDLLKQHFSGVKRSVFEKDLAEKNWVILVENTAGQLVGFSTIVNYQVTHKGERVWVVYSGDTIIDPSAWRSFALSRIWIQTIQKICPTDENEKLVWLLISSGYRTYRFLPVYWQEFFPKYDQETPREIEELMHYLAKERFGKHYDGVKGVVRFPKPQRLSDHLADIPEGKLSDPHVAHFLRLNPGYKDGDELVCFTFLQDENLTPAGHRMIKPSIRKQAISV